MEFKIISLRPQISCLFLVFFIGFAASDIDKDKEKCASQVVGLATCLPYVTGDAKAPPKDCCTGLKQVIQNSPECICLLVKDRDDPSLGLKINATLALSLPTQCQIPANISECPSLLHLAPNSPEAKVFDDFVNSAKKSNATTVAPATGGTSTTSNQHSDGGKRRRWLGIEMASALLLITTVLINSNARLIFN